MASDNNWIDDTVHDFIHSPIWTAPLHTFVEANCVTFDYDDDDEDETNSEKDLMEKSTEEQKRIHQHYQHLVDSLIDSLGKDLGLDQNELNRACQPPTSSKDLAIADESYEQLYSARDFQLFQNMMKRKNLILQLQALVSLQLQWGLLTRGDTSDDLVLALLLQATSSSSSHRGSVALPSETIQVPTAIRQRQKIEPKPKYDDDDDDDVVITPQREPLPSSSRKTKPKVEVKKPAKEEYRLPDLRRKGGSDLDAEWHRDLRRQDSKNNDDDDDQSAAAPVPQSIETIPEKVLRQKLRDLTERTSSAVDDETAAAMQARKKFLQDQREKIVNEKRAERARELEQQQASHARPQSAAHTARKAMATTDENKRDEQQQPQIPNDELNKRRAMMAKLKREVVDKQ